MNKIPIAFVIPFASKIFCKNWKLACFFLNQTVQSLLNSSNKDFVIVIVGNERPPDLVSNDSRVFFIETEGIQNIAPNSINLRENIVRDRSLKTQTGWEYARERFAPRYVMKVDADDFLSRHLVDFVAQSPDAPGFLITDGWLWNTGARYFMESNERFLNLCGTSVIVHSSVADLEIDDSQLQSAFAPNLPHVIKEFKTLCLLTENHTYAKQLMLMRDLEMKRVPFRASIYRVGNLNSVTGRTVKFHSLRFFLGRLRRLRFIAPALRSEFLIPVG